MEHPERDALDLEEQLVEERQKRWMEKEMWEKTWGDNERLQGWRKERIVGTGGGRN